MNFERAIKIAEAEKDSGLPFVAYEGKAQALVALGRPDEAKSVLQDALAKARSQQKQGHQAQLLIILAKLAAQGGNQQEAIADLEDAGRLAATVKFHRMEADAMFELAKLYRDSGDLAAADACATQGLAASQQVGDRYYVPRNLTILADLKARRAFAVTVLPEIRELGFLSVNAEDRGSGTETSPPFPPQTPQFSQRCVQPFAHDFTAPQPDFVDAVRLCRIATIAHVVDQEHSHLGQCQEGLPRPFLDQVRWRHHQARIWPAGAMNQHASEGNECLARAALCHDIGVVRKKPPLAHAHDCEGLGRIRRAQHPREKWRRSFVDAVQGGVR